MSHATVWRILQEMLLCPYYLERVHALTRADFPSLMHFCNLYLNQTILQVDFANCFVHWWSMLHTWENYVTENYVTQNDLLFAHTYFLPSLPLRPSSTETNVAAHRFLNKICFNEGYLSGPKVCRSILETPCITLPCFHWPLCRATPNGEIFMQKWSRWFSKKVCLYINLKKMVKHSLWYI